MLDQTNEGLQPLPAEIRTESLFPSGIRLIFPRHQGGGLRTAMFFITGLPLSLMMLAGSTMCFLSAFGVVDVGEANVSLLWFLPFGFFFAIPAVGLPLWELYVFYGHDEIELSSEGLKTVQRLGPLRWTRTCPLQNIERFNVPPSRSAFGWNPSGDALVAELTEHEDENDVILLRYYPDDFLMEVAEWLSGQISEMRSSVAAEPVEAVSESLEDRLQKPLRDQPQSSRIRVEPRGKRTILHIPPTGLLKHGGGVGAVTGVAAIGMTVIAGIAAFHLDLGIMIGFLVFFSFMSLLSLGVFLWAFNGASRQTTVTVSPDRLKVEQSAPFGNRSYEWQTDEISDFYVGPSRFGTSPHRTREGEWRPASSLHSPHGPGRNREQRQVAELQIRLRDEDPVGFFAGRDDRELRWLATVLEQELHRDPSS